MGVDTETWKSKIEHFHLSCRSNWARNRKQPLRADWSPIFIPGFTLLVLALCFTPIQQSEGDQAWISSIHNNTSTWNTGSMPNSTLRGIKSVCITSYAFMETFIHNVADQHGWLGFNPGHKNTNR